MDTTVNTNTELDTKMPYYPRPSGRGIRHAYPPTRRPRPVIHREAKTVTPGRGRGRPSASWRSEVSQFATLEGYIRANITTVHPYLINRDIVSGPPLYRRVHYSDDLKEEISRIHKKKNELKRRWRTVNP